MPAETSVCADALTSDWYDQLLTEVDYHCSFCDSVHTSVAELEEKVRQAYQSTADSMRGLHDPREIAQRWFGMWAFAAEVLAQAAFQREAHQICGVDIAAIESFRAAAEERFHLHCPPAGDVSPAP